jgi:hypothetical protein
MPRALPTPRAWHVRLETLESARELDRSEAAEAREAQRAWAIALVSLAVTVLLAVAGGIIAGSVAYGELRGQVTGIERSVHDMREDLRARQAGAY